MAGSNASGSPTPMETTEMPGEQPNPQVEGVTEEQWKAMKQITQWVYDYRDPE